MSPTAWVVHHWKFERWLLHCNILTSLALDLLIVQHNVSRLTDIDRGGKCLISRSSSSTSSLDKVMRVGRD